MIDILIANRIQIVLFCSFLYLYIRVFQRTYDFKLWEKKVLTQEEQRDIDKVMGAEVGFFLSFIISFVFNMRVQHIITFLIALIVVFIILKLKKKK